MRKIVIILSGASVNPRNPLENDTYSEKPLVSASVKICKSKLALRLKLTGETWHATTQSAL